MSGNATTPLESVFAARGITKIYHMGEVDVQTGVLILEVIPKINRELGATTAVITHHAVIADRVAHLTGGKITGVETNKTKREASELTW